MEDDVKCWYGARLMNFDPKLIWKEGTAHPALEVLHEDNHLLVVFKPHRALIQSDGSGHTTLFEATCDWLKTKYAKPGRVYLGLIHRLDRPASGLVVFAKTSKAAGRLSEQFRSREVEKGYELLVEGVPPTPAGKLVGSLLAPEEGNVRVVPDGEAGAKRAELDYRVIQSRNGKSLVHVDLGTGRKHQIRVQMAHAGCPIVGDSRYGAKGLFEEGSIALVATHLAVTHPTTGERLQFSLPERLSSVRQAWA